MAELIASIPFFAEALDYQGTGFLAGLLHPILGLDHNLSIIGISLYGLLLDKEKSILYPTIFILFLAIGGTIGIGSDTSMLKEKIIACSVLVIGISIAFSIKPIFNLALILSALFGFIHGCAHGAEIPPQATSFQYITGYSVGAIVLSLVGYMIYYFISKSKRTTILPIFMGGLIFGSGLIFFLT